MGKIKLGGYIFISWIGDHTPRHVHVFKDGKLILKWNLESSVAMAGHPSRRVLALIRILLKEGKL